MGWQQSDKHQNTADRRAVPDGTYINNIRIGPPEDPTVFVEKGQTFVEIEKPVISLDSSLIGVFDVEDQEDVVPKISSRIFLKIPHIQLDANGLEIK